MITAAAWTCIYRSFWTFLIPGPVTVYILIFLNTANVANSCGCAN